MNIFRGTEGPSQAVTKIAFLTSVFERLVADAGVRRERIEQLLAEMSEERHEAASEAEQRRAA